jgi:hypothetical protein
MLDGNETEAINIHGNVQESVQPDIVILPLRFPNKDAALDEQQSLISGTHRAKNLGKQALPARPLKIEWGQQSQSRSHPTSRSEPTLAT